MRRKYIIVRTQFEAYHRWVDAPDEVAFLRSYHRHMFHVSVKLLVTHYNREKEFFMVKRAIDSHLVKYYAGRKFNKSCEQIAEELLISFFAKSVSVFEDGENGSEVIEE